MEMRCRSPLESSQSFSPMLAFQPPGSFSANLFTLASFAAAGRADQRRNLPLFRRKGHIFQHRFAVLIGKPHMVEHDIAVAIGELFAAGLHGANVPRSHPVQDNTDPPWHRKPEHRRTQ